MVGEGGHLKGGGGGGVGVGGMRENHFAQGRARTHACILPEQNGQLNRPPWWGHHHRGPTVLPPVFASFCELD